MRGEKQRAAVLARLFSSACCRDFCGERIAQIADFVVIPTEQTEHRVYNDKDAC
jgi:hypothetical protein